MSEPNDPLSFYSGAKATPPPSESAAGTSPETAQYAEPDGTAAPKDVGDAPDSRDAPDLRDAPDSGDAPDAADLPDPDSIEQDDAHGTPGGFDASAPGARPGWTPGSATAPSPEEDEALRQERARRFGRSPEEPGEDEPTSTFETGGASTTELGAGAAEEFAEDGSGRPVTPLPASPATGVSAGTATATVPATRSMPATPVARVSSAPEASDTDKTEDPFEGFNEGPESRAAAHWWVVLVALVFVPVAWYLLADGGERLAWSLKHADEANVWAYVELGAGLLAAFIVLLAARWSSVGPVIMGTLTMLIGAAYVAFPDRAHQLLVDNAEVFTRLGQFGQNVLDHLQRDAMTGRLLLYGLALIMAGVISHGARRQGRRQEHVAQEIGQ